MSSELYIFFCFLSILPRMHALQEYLLYAKPADIAAHPIKKPAGEDSSAG